MLVLPVGTKWGATKKTLPSLGRSVLSAEKVPPWSKMNSTPFVPSDAGGRSVAPEGEERMIVTGGVDREVAIDVEGRLGRVRNMKLRVAHSEALDARLTDVGAVLAVVDLRIAVLVVLDGIATAPAGVGE